MARSSLLNGSPVDETVALEQSIDPREVLASLGYDATSEPSRVKGGWDTLLWRFQTPDGGDHSLRIYFLPTREDVVERERIALTALAQARFPAPRIETSGRFRDLPAMVLSWCPGRPVLADLEQKPWLVWRLSRLFGRAHAELHRIAPPPEFVAESRDVFFRVPPEYFPLAEQASSLGLATDTLLHLDFHPLNVVGDGRTVTGVVDWGGAAAGDRRMDLARTHITIATAPIPPGPTKPLLAMIRGVMLRGWLSGYRQAAGGMPQYRPLLAWAGATLFQELVAVIDREVVWATPSYLDEMRRQIRGWARQAGIAMPAASTASGRA